MRYLELTAEHQTQFRHQPIIQGEPLNFVRTLFVLAVLAWAITPAMPNLVRFKTSPAFAMPVKAGPLPVKRSRKNIFPSGDMLAEALRNAPADQL